MRERKSRPPRTLKQRAIALLARRDYSRAELGARLAAAGGAADEIESLLLELEHGGYLSDLRFAAAMVSQKRRAYGRRAIAQSLRERGVSPGTAKDALAELDGVDEIVAATALWQRRFGVPPADERDKARQVRFLLSRGYTTAVAFKVLKAAGAAIDDR